LLKIFFFVEEVDFFFEKLVKNEYEEMSAVDQAGGTSWKKSY